MQDGFLPRCAAWVVVKVPTGINLNLARRGG